MKYIYPAIFTEEEDGILVDFPDLPNCYTDGANLEEAFENAEDALALALWHLEEEHAEIPAPSTPASLSVPTRIRRPRAHGHTARAANERHAHRTQERHPPRLDGHPCTRAQHQLLETPAKCDPQRVRYWCISSTEIE